LLRLCAQRSHGHDRHADRAGAQTGQPRRHDGARLGLPLSLSGQDSEQTRETRAFAERLGKRVGVPVELYDERFTTRIASRSAGVASSEHSRAAAVLLEDWLARKA
jgi:putative Holliday junction resolvase